MSSSVFLWVREALNRLFKFKDLFVGVILCLMMIRSLHGTVDQPVSIYTMLEQQSDQPSLAQNPGDRIHYPARVPASMFGATVDHTISLVDLVDTNRHVDCPSPLERMNDIILQESEVVGSDRDRRQLQRKIPKIIHMTSKSRCLTQGFADNVRKWHFSDHSFYFHDDEAVDRLLMQRYWSDFPHIPLAMKCLRSGAAKADLWRYLVLWEYGGIYTDLDNKPGKDFFIQPNNTSTSDSNAGRNGATSLVIQDDDDAFFVVEELGVLSQYFLATSPKHPLMYLAVQNTLSRLLEVPHVGNQVIPQVTGPGALKMAFKYFMGTPDTPQNGRVRQGKYVGVGNREVTVVGHKATGSNNYVVRATVSGKWGQYKDMDMKHYSKIAKKKFNESCLVHIYNYDYHRETLNMTNW